MVSIMSPLWIIYIFCLSCDDFHFTLIDFLRLLFHYGSLCHRKCLEKANRFLDLCVDFGHRYRCHESREGQERHDLPCLHLSLFGDLIDVAK